MVLDVETYVLVLKYSAVNECASMFTLTCSRRLCIGANSTISSICLSSKSDINLHYDETNLPL